MAYNLDESRGSDWIILSEKHLNSATILYKNGGDLGIACFHIQQAMIKMLKGYILGKTGELIDEKSLIRLVDIATVEDKEFSRFRCDAPYLSSFYIEDTYPAEDPLWVEEKDVKYAFEIYNLMKQLVEKN